MKVFFIGTVLFSRKMLEIFLENKSIDLVGLATKSVSAFNSDHTDLSDLAIKHGIPYKFVKDINAPHIADWISDFKPDVIFCLGWSSLIKKYLRYSENWCCSEEDIRTLARFRGSRAGYHFAEAFQVVRIIE
jgi:methionyl-tRNA formyltransferase